MGECVAKLPHSCGTRQGLQVFQQEDGSFDGYCFSCGKVVADPLGNKKLEDLPKAQRFKMSQEEIEERLEEIRSCSSSDLKKRKLRKAALDMYGIKIGANPETGEGQEFAFFPYGDGFKCVHLETKRMWWINRPKGKLLFGWDQAKSKGVRKLIITEGEWDAVAMARILEMKTKEQFKDNIPAVVSLPDGCKSAKKVLSELAPEIRKHFKDVVLAFDMDDAGQDAVQDALSVMPEATVASLPHKDANECLKKGATKAAFDAVMFNNVKPKNTRLVYGEDLHAEAREQAKWGELTWPWKHLNDTTRGIRYGETIYIGAGVKMGKSEVLNALAAHFIKEHEVKVFMAKPEEANKKTYKLLAGKMEGKVFHDPNKEFDYEAYDRAGEALAGKLAMVNLYQHLGWESLEADIRAAAAWGAKAVFIDPITNLTNGMESGEANVALQKYAQEASAMALDLGIVIFLFCHLKAPAGGEGHERGGAVLSTQFAGSRAMMRSCNLMLGLEGNKDPELPEEERNQRTLVLLEDREFGETGRFNLYWDKKTQLFNEMEF